MTATSSGTDPIPQFFTQDELVERWKGTVRHATLATWRSRNLGPPYVKIGGRVLYKGAEVVAWEQKNSRCQS